MDDRQIRRHLAMRATVQLVDMHRERLAPDVLEQVEELREIVARIEQLAADQMQRDAPGQHLRPHIVKLRRDHMIPLARMTRPLFAADPDVLAALRIPHMRAKEPLHEAAMRMVKALTPHRRYLARCHVDPRRVQRLREEAILLRKREKELYAQSPASKLATVRIKAELSRGSGLMSTFRGVFAATPLELGERIVAKGRLRVPKKLGRPRKKKPKKDPPQ